MQASIEVITPAFAQQLLEQNPHNRHVTPAVVERYALDMAEGRWQEGNGQTVVISRNGDLMDGQHRMHAIVRSGVPISMLVVRNVDPETFKTIDTGKPRSLPDLLSIEGYKNSIVVAGTGRMAWNYAAGVSPGYSPNKTTLEEFINNQPNISKIVQQVTTASSGKTYPKTPLAAVMFLANNDGSMNKEVETFIEGVTSGANLYKGDPRLTLREWVLYHKLKANGRISMTSSALFAAAARAWNAHASGKTLAQIKGLENVSRANLPIIGYNKGAFADVPDLSVRWGEARRKNLRMGPLLQAQSALKGKEIEIEART